MHKRKVRQIVTVGKVAMGNTGPPPRLLLTSHSIHEWQTYVLNWGCFRLLIGRGPPCHRFIDIINFPFLILVPPTLSFRLGLSLSPGV